MFQLWYFYDNPLQCCLCVVDSVVTDDDTVAVETKVDPVTTPWPDLVVTKSMVIVA